MDARSGLFRAGTAIKGKNLLPVEAELPVEETVETPGRDVEDPADAPEVDVRVEPDPVRLHQAEKERENVVRCEHGLCEVCETNVRFFARKCNGSKKTNQGDRAGF